MTAYLKVVTVRSRTMKILLEAVLYLGFAIFCKAASMKKLDSSINLNPSDVTFYLYTRNNLTAAIPLDQHSLNSVDPKKPTKFIIHAYFESAEKLWYRNMISEYLKKGDYNVIQVDWSKPASDTYPSSARYTQDVGTVVGRLIANLHKNNEVSLDNVHVIGHSLGAHVAGYVGKEVIKQTGSQIGRITGLDPAAPLFEGMSVMMEGLNKHDAKIVDAIHTDGGLLGRSHTTGTVDFFPNGGMGPQPGCSTFSVTLPVVNYLELPDEVFCSHHKSVYYFIDSINNENFEALKCDSRDLFEENRCDGKTIALMGDNYSQKPETAGKFFLRTNSQPPYARNL